MPFKPGQSGNLSGRPKGVLTNTYKASLRRLMDRAIATHEESVEQALVAAVTNPKSVLPGLELWGRVRREIGPGSAEDETTRLVNVTVVLGSTGETKPDAALQAGGFTLDLPGSNGPEK